MERFPDPSWHIWGVFPMSKLVQAVLVGTIYGNSRGGLMLLLHMQNVAPLPQCFTAVVLSESVLKCFFLVITFITASVLKPGTRSSCSNWAPSSLPS